MTAAQVAQLCTDLLGASVGFTVAPTKGATGDWTVTASPNGAVDARQLAALETKHGISSPITSMVTFV